MSSFVLVWGGGDLASGIALRLYRAKIRVLVVEIDQPLAVRRSVSFAQAVYDGQTSIEGVTGQLIAEPQQMVSSWEESSVPVIVDPELDLLDKFKPVVLVDARMRKKFYPLSLDLADLIIGLGPGFSAGENCHAAIETNRGHFLGRVLWEGSPQVDTGVPGKVQTYRKERVLHAPAGGVVETIVEIGDTVDTGAPILSVGGQVIRSPFPGVVRGLIHDGLPVHEGMKVGDVDPRPDNFRCWFVSEKAMAIGGGVLEAILTLDHIRSQLWEG